MFVTAGGTYSGRSFNYYDDSDGKMTLSGERQQGGETIVDRITWYDNDDGTVRQVWDVSKDSGTTWTVIFDGLYQKK